MLNFQTTVLRTVLSSRPAAIHNIVTTSPLCLVLLLWVYNWLCHREITSVLRRCGSDASCFQSFVHSAELICGYSVPNSALGLEDTDRYPCLQGTYLTYTHTKGCQVLWREIGKEGGECGAWRRMGERSCCLKEALTGLVMFNQ